MQFKLKSPKHHEPSAHMMMLRTSWPVEGDPSFASHLEPFLLDNLCTQPRPVSPKPRLQCGCRDALNLASLAHKLIIHLCLVAVTSLFTHWKTNKMVMNSWCFGQMEAHRRPATFIRDRCEGPITPWHFSQRMARSQNVCKTLAYAELLMFFFILSFWRIHNVLDVCITY